MWVSVCLWVWVWVWVRVCWYGPLPPPPLCTSYALVQAAVGVGTVLIVYFGVANTRGGGTYVVVGFGCGYYIGKGYQKESGPPTAQPKEAHRALCSRCAKSRLVSTTGSHGSQGPEFCTTDAVLNGSCTLLQGGFRGVPGINNVIIGAVPALCENAP